MRRSLLFFLGLVVITVGLAVAVGSLLRRDHSVETCKANMDLLGKGLTVYAKDHGGLLPMASGQEWPLRYEGYLLSLSPLYCPADKTATEDYGKALQNALKNPGYSSMHTLLLLRERNQTLTDYELPAAVSGAALKKLSPRTVILEEHGPGHGGKHWALYADDSFEMCDGTLPHTPHAAFR